MTNSKNTGEIKNGMTGQFFDKEALREEVEEKISRSGLMKNVTIGVQRPSERELVKRPSLFPGIEEYCYVYGSNGNETQWNVKLTPELLERVRLNEDEIWKAAERNTFCEKEMTVKNLQSMLKDLFGTDMTDDTFISGVSMFVVSNPRRLHGAVQIFNKKAVRNWACSRGYNSLIVLPSSIHEVIVVPAEEMDFNREELDIMVMEVNATQVDPVEQLSDRAYLIDVSSF